MELKDYAKQGRVFFFFLMFLSPRLGPSSLSAGCLPFLPSQLKMAPIASSPAA